MVVEHQIEVDQQLLEGREVDVEVEEGHALVEGEGVLDELAVSHAVINLFKTDHEQQPSP